MNALGKRFRTPHYGAFLAMLLSLLVLLPAWFWIEGWYQNGLIKQAKAAAAEQISARANALTSAVDQRIALLQGLYAFTRTEWPDTEFDQPFEIYSSGIYFNSTGVRTLMIAPEGIARYIFPISDSQALSGYDILNDPDPETRADVQRAIHNRAITLSRPGELRQGGFGLTAWEAVYRGSDLWGLVSIAVDMNTVLADSGLTDPANGLEMALRDDTGQNFFGPDALWLEAPVTQKIVLPEGTWELGGAPPGGWENAIRPQMEVFVLGSLLIVGLVAAMIFLMVNRQGQLGQAVSLRTQQIAAAQEKLELQVEQRTRELATLMQVSRRIGSTLALDPLLGQVLAEMKNVLDYAFAQIYQPDEAGKWLLVSEAGTPPEGNGASYHLLDENLIEGVITSLQPVIACDWPAGGEGREKMCWMGIPLVIKKRATGIVVFINQDPGYYREEHANLALAFAQQVAVAIENARLYEQAGQLAVLEERQRLARELHDSVSQVLYSIGLGSKAARTALDHNPSQIAEALDYVNRLAEAGQVEMRALIFELRPESLRNDGLVIALEKQAAVLRARHQLEVQLNLCPEPAISLAMKETFYRISQEAIHNIVKHARANRVTLALSCDDHQICLEVGDDGIGFDPLGDYPGHLGLQSMRERALKSGGQIEIESVVGKGTRIQFVIHLG